MLTGRIDVVGHGREQGHIGVGHDLDPVRTHGFIGGGELRVDRDELDATFLDLLPAGHHLVVRHRVFDAVVLEGVATHPDHHFGVLSHHFPRCLGRVHLHVTNDVGQADLRRAARIVARGDGMAPDEAKQTTLQHLWAQQPGVRPATIGATEQRFIAVLFCGAQDGVGRQGQRLFPAHPHKRLLTAQVGLSVAFGIGEIRLSHHGVLHASLVVDTTDRAFGQHGGGRGIYVFKRLYTYQHAVLHHRLERPPVVGAGNDHGVGSEGLVRPKPSQAAGGHSRCHRSLQQAASRDCHDGSP